MRYRKLDANGDYTLGQGANTFYYDTDAVVQAIKTGFSLRKGTFWRNVNAGFPLFQQILGQSAGAEALKAIELTCSNQVSKTTGVRNLISYSSKFDSQTRAHSYQALVDTVYSTTVPISGTF